MGGTARQFNKMYLDYKMKFKKPIQNIAQLMPDGFSDQYFVDSFKRLYPNMWDDLKKQYEYWHEKNEFIIKHGNKSRYNFRKPYNFILDCSYGVRSKQRKSNDIKSLTPTEVSQREAEILKASNHKHNTQKSKQSRYLYLVQEIEPSYASVFIDKYFKTNDLHERLEIIRELSKFKSENIVRFYYKVNAGTRNFSLKTESMQYIQGVGLPFVLRRKKKGKKNYIDNEIVKNESSPEILMQRLYVNELEKIKKFDVFISHNSKDEKAIVDLYKNLNKQGLVAYVDWASDKFDLKRQWCNSTTSLIIKERIKQSKIFIVYFSDNILSSQWCPWELGYADALGKKICILNLTETQIPEFYFSYAKLSVNGNDFIISEGDKQHPLHVWIKQ